MRDLFSTDGSSSHVIPENRICYNYLHPGFSRKLNHLRDVQEGCPNICLSLRIIRSLTSDRGLFWLLYWYQCWSHMPQMGELSLWSNFNSWKHLSKRKNARPSDLYLFPLHPTSLHAYLLSSDVCASFLLRSVLSITQIRPPMWWGSAYPSTWPNMKCLWMDREPIVKHLLWMKYRQSLVVVV